LRIGIYQAEPQFTVGYLPQFGLELGTRVDR